MSHRRSLLHKKPSSTNYFIIEVTVSNGDTVDLPTYSGGTYACDVDWGDGNTSSGGIPNGAWRSNTYAVAGVYEIKISGTFTGFRVNNQAFRNYLTDIKQFGDVALDILDLRNCDQLTSVSCIDTPTFLPNTNLSQLFMQCGNITSWNNIENWDTSNVTNFASMFRQTGFSPDVSSWDTSNVTNFTSTFTQYTGNIDISSWDVSSVQTMKSLLLFSGFSPDISGWNPLSLTNLSDAFRVSGSSTFNSDISHWDVSNVSNFNQCFLNAGSFSQDLSTWDISSATDMVEFGKNAAFTTQQWTDMLIAWNGLASPPQNINIEVTSNYFSSASSARANLISTHGWTITDNGVI